MLRNVVVNTAKVIGRAGVGYGLEKAAESAKEGIEGDKKPEGNAKPPGNKPRLELGDTAGETADKLRARTGQLSIGDSLKCKAERAQRTVENVADAARHPHRTGQAMKNEIENLVDSSAELRDEVQGLRRLANGETSLQEKTALGATAVQVAATNAWDTTVKAAKVASAAPSFGKEGIKDVAQAAQEHVAEQAKVTAATSAIIHGAAKAMQIPAAPLPVKVFGKSVEVVNGLATGTAIADMKKQVEESVPGPVREKLGEIGRNG